MQSGGGLVEDVDGAAGGALLQFGRELDPLGLPAGQRRRRLAQAHVTQADVDEGFEIAVDAADRLEELAGVLDGHVEDLRDGLALVVHLQGLAVVAGALAHLAGDVDVGQEVHLDLDRPVARARLAAAALDVEGEPARFVASDLGLGGGGEQGADLVENAGVGGGVGARGAPDRRLVDAHEFVDAVQAGHPGVPAGHHARSVEPVGQHAGQDVVDQCGLSRPGNPGDRGEQAQRERHVEVAQVVLAGADHGELTLAVRRAPHGRNLDALLAGQVGPGDRVGVSQQLVVGPAVHHPPAMLAGGRPDVDDPVGVGDGVLVVLDDDQGVTQIPQAREGFDQAAVVALVQPDGRLVEDVEHTHQAGADLGGQPDALRLAAGERPRRPPERQVVQADVEQEAQPGLDLLEHLAGDGGLAGAQGEFPEELRTLRDGQLAHLRDGFGAERPGRQGDREDLGLEPGPLALRAGNVAHEALVALLHQLGVGLLQLALQERHDALELRVVGAGAAVAVAVSHVHLLVAALQDRLAGPGGQLAPRRVDVEVHRLAQTRQHAGEVVRAVAHRPGRDGPLGQGELRVGDHQFGVDLLADAQAAALRAGPVGRVERERPRLEVVDGQRVPAGAGQLLGEPLFAVRVALVAVDEVEHHDPVRQAQGGLHRVGQPLFGAGLDGEPVDDHLDVVLLLLLQRRRFGQRMHHPVDPDPAVALGVELVEEVDELTLAGANHRREHLEADALLHGEHLIDDLLRGLPGDALAADRAVRGAGPGVEQSQVVVDLGDGADRGARVAVGGLLIDRYRRGQALDEVDVGLVHLAQELPGVGAQRLHVAALPLGENGVEGQRGLARSGQPGEDDQAVAGQVQVDAAEVVFARALDDQPIHAPMLCAGPDGH